MSDPLDRYRHAAREAMLMSQRSMVNGVRTASDTAYIRADEALRAAKTLPEIARVRDEFTAAMTRMAGSLDAAAR